MELYNKKDNPNLNPETIGTENKLLSANKIPDVNKTTDTDLHDEGIDLVGSGVNEDNEFTGQETPITSPESPKVSETLVPSISSTPPTPPPEPPKLPTVTPGVITPQPSFIPKITSPQISVSPTNVPASPAIPSIKNDPSIKPVRTFKSDAEEAVRYKNVSTIDIAVAEQKKREATPIEYIEPRESHPGIFIAVVITVILVIGVGWFYWFKTSQTEKPEPIRASIETIIPYTTGSTLVLNSESDSLVLIGAKLNAANAGLGNVYALVPTQNATSTVYADISLVFANVNMPDRLARSLASEYMIGTYTYDVNGPFIILKNTFFQNAFAGMLEWEKDMRNDLLSLIQVSHPSERSVTANTDKFEDVVVSNIDARALRGNDGRIILAYIFADPETIVITTNENTLKYVLDRLLTVRTIQ
ncbi:MAG: hypothetical protein Q7R72_02555 [bacterium]|nr:hypothetical protein [bacterium]